MPSQLGSSINTYFSRLIPLPIFMYALGQYIFFNRLSSGTNDSVQVVMWICLGYLVFPYKSIDKYINRNKRKVDEGTYDHHSKNFLFTYEKVNPVQFITDEYDPNEVKQGIKKKFTQGNVDFKNLLRYSEYQSMRERARDPVDFSKLFKRSVLVKEVFGNPQR